MSKETGNKNGKWTFANTPVGKPQSIGVRSRLKLRRGRAFAVLTEYDGVFESNEDMPDVIEIERIITRDEVLQHGANVNAFLEGEFEGIVSARFGGREK